LISQIAISNPLLRSQIAILKILIDKKNGKRSDCFRGN